MTLDQAPPPPPAADPADRLAPLTYTAAELAQALGCSERHVWRLHAAGGLPAAVHIGRLVRWHRTLIDRWLAAGCPPAARKTTR
jgi:excisionase family DNA binding protein